MTLSTNVWVLDPIDFAQVWTVAQMLVKRYSRDGIEPVWKDEARDIGRARSNEPGQGLCAWLLARYSDTPDPLHDGTVKHDEDCDDPCTSSWCVRSAQRYWVELDFDTAYGYVGAGGASAGDLHATILDQLGTFLDRQGVRWSWQNEFTGDIYRGHDGLATLGSSAREARNWFVGEVLPAILARDLAEG